MTPSEIQIKKVPLLDLQAQFETIRPKTIRPAHLAQRKRLDFGEGTFF